MTVPKDWRTSVAKRPLLSAYPNATFTSITSRDMERASTKLRIGAFHGKYHTCNTRDVCKIIFIKVSRRLGVLVASTPGNTSKGPRAKRTKPNHHTLGSEAEDQKANGSQPARTIVYIQTFLVKYLKPTGHTTINNLLHRYSQMTDVRRMGKGSSKIYLSGLWIRACVQAMPTNFWTNHGTRHTHSAWLFFDIVPFKVFVADVVWWFA